MIAVPVFVVGQDAATDITIREVFIVGNKKTKTDIILREMSLLKGKTFADTLINQLIEEDKMRVYNTNLFDEVKIQTLNAGNNEVVVMVEVNERWYIYPGIIFQLADRNFNDWWVNQNHDLSRVNLGVRYQQYNFRGRRELLNLIFQMGFERKVLVSWRIPYIEKTQKHGLAFTYGYNESRNAGYRTEDHVRQFIGEERILRRGTKAGVTYRFRNSFYNVHRVQLSFHHKTIDDTVALLNPNYFNNSATTQRHFDISYQFTRDLRNNNNYPTKGYLIDIRAEKTGTGIYKQLDIFDIMVSYSKYWEIGKNFSFAAGIVGFSSWPENQPYEKYFGLGNGQVLVRGYEQDLIEGHKYFLYKSTLRKRLFKYTQDISPVMPLKQFQKVPVAIYAKIFFDAGYVENYPQYEVNERLSNSILHGLGAGLDLVTIYDLVTRFEWSLNADNQVRFALNAKVEF